MLVNLTKLIIVPLVWLCCLGTSTAQNFTTKGTEFWAAYGVHAGMYKADGSLYTNGGSQKMVFYFLSNITTNVTVEIPATGWKRHYRVIAGKVTETDEMPKFGASDARLLHEGVSNKGIHITSDDIITAYCHIYDEKSSATTLLIPVNICGQEYYALGYSQKAATPFAHSYCFVIATEDNTEIEVTPAANTLGHPAGVPFAQTLNKGEVLNLFGDSTGKAAESYTGNDLSGTYIRTVVQPGNDVCKKVVVFSGSAATSITCGVGPSTSDALFSQVPCLDNWSTSFIAVPTLKMPVNRYRVLVIDAAQKVFINGRQLTGLINNRYYEFRASKVVSIHSDSLIAVAQYISSAGQCNNELPEKGGDPEMMFLSPNGGGINNTMINATSHNDIQAHFINVVMKTIAIDSFRLDGQAMPQAFKIFDRNPEYATAQIEVSPGRHILVCDSGFNTYAYGYGKFESYGYNAGFATRHLYGYIGVRNPYKTVADSITTCTATAFRFYFDIEEKLTSLLCKFNNNSRLQPYSDMWLTNLKPDSSYRVDTINTTFYRYYLPDSFHYSVVEPFPVSLVAYYPDPKGCIVKKLFNFSINVIQKPLASLFFQYNECINSKLAFYDKSLAFGSNLVQWNWDFNDGTTSGDRNPQHQFTDYGEYHLLLRAINAVGCYDDTAKMIGMYHKPFSSFEVSGDRCSKQDVLLKSTATVKNDELSEWKWNFPDGTTALAQNLVKSFADSGNYQVKLVTKSAHGCTDTATQLLHIYQSPQVKVPAVLFMPAGDTLQLKPAYTGNIKSYSWTPATSLSSNTVPYPVTSATADIKYIVTALSADVPCKAIATTIVKMQQKIHIPNAFTPNGDGRNDTWRIYNLEGYASCTVSVFNRLGNRVYYSRGYSTPWNGTSNNQPLPAGTYLYVINIPGKSGSTNQSGSVTIIR